MNWLSSPGKAPKPCKVDVIGNPISLTNSLNESLALGPELITPPPVYITGFLALEIKFKSSSISP